MTKETRSHLKTPLEKRDGLWRAEPKPGEKSIPSAVWTTNTAKVQAAGNRRSYEEG